MFIKAELWEKLVGYISSTKKPESEIWVSSSTYSIPGHVNINHDIIHLSTNNNYGRKMPNGKFN
jgi:hypothetical protein